MILQSDFNDEREIIVDLPQIYSSSIESVIMNEYKICILKKNVIVESINYYKAIYSNYIGEKTENIICVISYRIE